MKRFLSCFLAVTLCLSLCSCGKSKSEEAQKVDDMILTIENVDLQSGAAIAEAEEAYQALTKADQKSVESYKQLVEDRKNYDALLAGAVSKAIQQIGYVYDGSGAEIKYARKEYDKLSDDQKLLVDNYEELEQAENEYIRLKVEPVENLIRGLSRFDLNAERIPEGLSDAIDEAEEAYNDLEETYQNKVGNLGDLEAAKSYLSDKRVSNVIALIDENLKEIDFSSGDSLLLANTAYSLLTDEEKARITNYNVLKAAQEEYDNLQPIQLNSYRLKKDLIGDPELYLSATNVSDKIIKEFSATVFAYDDDGVPVSVYLGDYAKGIRYGSAIKPGEKTKSNSYWTLYATYSDIKQLVVILNDVEFFDGTSWTNSQYGTLVDKYEQKLLEEGDTNILQRG